MQLRKKKKREGKEEIIGRTSSIFITTALLQSCAEQNQKEQYQTCTTNY